MSVVIQAIIYLSNPEIDFSNFILANSNHFNIKLENYKYSDSINIVVYISGEDRTFNESLAEIAKKISIEDHKSLLIEYDDRLGYRYSCIYKEGILTKEFTPEDEVWVLVDEEGKPLLKHKFSPIQVEEDDNDENEYQTLFNSIELGLDEFGISEEWKKIFNFILKSRR